MNPSMKITALLIASTLTASLLTACSPETASMTTTPEVVQPQRPVFPDVQEQKAQWYTEDGGQSKLDFNPQVDILFITDNSDSMRTAQENLVRNIDKFADGINQNKMIDYHIGVISTWDASERFASTKKDQYGIGELRFIKDSKNQNYNQRFVTRNERGMTASTLDIGVAALKDGGPENEEFFAPLLAAMEKSGNGQPNDGFFRPDSQLVVVFLTDADDSNKELAPSEVAQKLLAFKNDRTDKVSVYGALVSKSDDDKYKDWALRVHPKYNEQCFDMTKKVPKENGTCKDGIGPQRLEDFIVAANATPGLTPAEIREKYIMSIISKNFGSDLANIGSDIKIRTLAKEIPLSRIPVVEDDKLQVRVRYGTPAELAAGRGQVIPQHEKYGWTYDADKNSVKLSGDVKYQYKEGARFAVDVKAVIVAD